MSIAKVSEALILLAILRLRHKWKRSPNRNEVRSYTEELLNDKLTDEQFRALLSSLERKAHIRVDNEQLQISMRFIYYYTEILQPGDEDLETVAYIKRRTQEMEECWSLLSDEELKGARECFM